MQCGSRQLRYHHGPSRTFTARHVISRDITRHHVISQKLKNIKKFNLIFFFLYFFKLLCSKIPQQMYSKSIFVVILTSIDVTMYTEVFFPKYFFYFFFHLKRWKKKWVKIDFLANYQKSRFTLIFFSFFLMKKK
jgi:hypothetical protein